MAEHRRGTRENMPKRKKKISKAEFVRRFTGEAMKYLVSLPPGERDARIEAFGKSVVSSCGPKLSLPRIQW
jgi:hypothetical protein